MNEIETMFYDALLNVMKQDTEIKSEYGTAIISLYPDETTKDWIRGQARLKAGYGHIDFLIGIRPQFKIGNYKTDFIIYFDNPYLEENYVAIEIDGHEWHEKTKEQAMHDKQRERFLLRKDFPVMRFSGSEIFHNCEESAKECFSIMIDRVVLKIEQRKQIPIVIDRDEMIEEENNQ